MATASAGVVVVGTSSPACGTAPTGVVVEPPPPAPPPPGGTLNGVPTGRVVEVVVVVAGARVDEVASGARVVLGAPAVVVVVVVVVAGARVDEVASGARVVL